jgi:hypothetical protein
VEVEDSVLDFDPWRNKGRRLRQQYKKYYHPNGFILGSHLEVSVHVSSRRWIVSL